LKRPPETAGKPFIAAVWLAAGLEAAVSLVSAGDLEAFEAEQQQPTGVDYPGFTVLEAPPTYEVAAKMRLPRHKLRWFPAQLLGARLIPQKYNVYWSANAARRGDECCRF
jgi:hypothetical protein